jgi:regulator of protease activity HflC (stomatin/prohibitin superfamily)
MESALAWIGQIVQWIGQFIPRWQLLDSREGAVKFQTLLIRDLVRGKWDASLKPIALGPGLHMSWPATTSIKTWTVARQSVNLATQTITTGDGKTVAVGGFIIFKIVDVLEIVANAWHPDDCIKGIAAGAIHDVCSSSTWRELQQLKASGVLVAELLEDLRERLRPFGVEPIDAVITDFAPTRVLKVIQSTSSDT